MRADTQGFDAGADVVHRIGLAGGAVACVQAAADGQVAGREDRDATVDHDAPQQCGGVKHLLNPA